MHASYRLDEAHPTADLREVSWNGQTDLGYEVGSGVISASPTDTRNISTGASLYLYS